MLVTRNEIGLLMIDFDFGVPIPVGHEVVCISQTSPRAGRFHASFARCAIDLTARLVYADHAYWEHFKGRSHDMHPADAPALGPPWVINETIEGISLGGVLSMKDSQETRGSCTRLFVRPPEVT